jgi:hypothetical protein
MNRTQRTRPARFTTRVAGLALAALALTACGGEADESPAAPVETPTTTPSEEPAATPSEEPTEEPAGTTAQVTIEGESVEPVGQSVETEVGETVTLEVTADRAGELHVHATPEQYHDFTPGRTVIEMTFDKPGAVDVEEHESGALLLRVLVQ